MPDEHATRDARAPADPVMILVRPQMGENIGAAARAMLNFGLARMRIVDPRDGWPNERAVAMASGAGRVLDAAGVFETTAGATGDQTHVYATTARARDLVKPVMSPQEAVADAQARISVGERVGFLFGPERAGLENADLHAANTLITVPVNPDFASLNLAQCVLLIGYEWMRQGQATAPSNRQGRQLAPDGAALAPANIDEVERFSVFLAEALDERRFFWPEAKAETMRSNLRNLFSRLPLTEPDLRLLYGVLRHLKDRPVVKEQD